MIDSSIEATLNVSTGGVSSGAESIIGVISVLEPGGAIFDDDFTGGWDILWQNLSVANACYTCLLGFSSRLLREGLLTRFFFTKIHLVSQKARNVR